MFRSAGVGDKMNIKIILVSLYTFQINEKLFKGSKDFASLSLHDISLKIER